MSTSTRIKRIVRAKLHTLGGALPDHADESAFEWPRTDEPLPPDTSPDTRLLQSLAILELPPAATPAQIKTAYRRLCKRYHPDRFAEDRRKADLANELLAAINAAYAYAMKKVGHP